MKIGDIIEKDYFGKKHKYRVIGQGGDGYFITELVVGVVEPTTGEDIIDAVKEIKKPEKMPEKKPEKKQTVAKKTTSTKKK